MNEKIDYREVPREMGRSTQRRLLPILVMLFVAVSCGEDSTSGGSGSATTPDLEAFASLMASSGEGDVMVYGSLDQLADTADVVFTARLVGIRDGRTIGPVAGDRSEPDSGLDTMVLQVDEISFVTGDDSLLSGPVLVEVFPPSEGVDAAERVAPIGSEILVFGGDYTSPNASWIDGQSEGAKYLFPSPQGLIIEGEDGLVSLLGGIIEPLERPTDGTIDGIVAYLNDRAKGG